MSESSLFDLGALEASPATNDEGTTSSGLTTQTQSLYRKYRPQSFNAEEYYGQQHIVHTLQNAVALGRVAHAYLFCGPRGTGKTTTARLLAKAVNCLHDDPYQRPCNVCASCVAINRNATTDVIEIDAASNRGIDDIRDLRERVKYAPTQLKTKFYIIDEAHQITGAAANAFLKTLEEPPAHTKFVLATTDPEDLLPTIVSRCQRFDFRKIDLESMVQNLRRIAGLEDIAIDDEALVSIARHATGSLRDAQGLLDQVAVYREGEREQGDAIGVDVVRQVLGVSRNDRIEKLATALADRDPATALGTIASAVEDGDDVRQLGRQLTAYLRLLLHQRAGGSPDADETARELAAQFSLAQLTEITRLFVDIDYKIKHAAFPQLPLELALVDAATLDSAKPVTTSQARPVQETAATYDSLPPADAAPPRTTLRDRVRGREATSSAPATPSPAQTRPERTEVSRSEPAPQSPASTSVNRTNPNASRRLNQESPKSAQASTEPAEAKTPAASKPGPSATPIQSDDNGTELSLDTVVDQWGRIRAEIKAVNRRIEALLLEFDPAAVVGNRLLLTSAYEFHRNRVNSDEARVVIEDVISRLIGTRVQVSAVSKDEARSMANSAIRSPVSENKVDKARPPASEPKPEPTPAVSQPSEGVDQTPDAEMDSILNAARNLFDGEILD